MVTVPQEELSYPMGGIRPLWIRPRHPTKGRRWSHCCRDASVRLQLPPALSEMCESVWEARSGDEAKAGEDQQLTAVTIVAKLGTSPGTALIRAILWVQRAFSVTAMGTFGRTTHLEQRRVGFHFAS